MKEGDFNTKFFHREAVANRSDVRKEEVVEGAVVDYYEILLKEKVDWEPTIGSLGFSLIVREVNGWRGQWRSKREKEWRSVEHVTKLGPKWFLFGFY